MCWENTKNTWKILNEVINPKKESNKLPSDFTNIGPNLSNSIDSSSRCYSSYLTGNMINSMHLKLVTDIEVKEIINNLRCGTSSGYYQIPMWLVKDSAEVISSPLMNTINLSINSGIVPDELKIEN